MTTLGSPRRARAKAQSDKANHSLPVYEHCLVLGSLQQHSPSGKAPLLFAYCLRTLRCNIVLYRARHGLAHKEDFQQLLAPAVPCGNNGTGSPRRWCTTKSPSFRSSQQEQQMWAKRKLTAHDPGHLIQGRKPPTRPRPGATTFWRGSRAQFAPLTQPDTFLRTFLKVISYRRQHKAAKQGMREPQ